MTTTSADYRFICDLVRRESAIVLDESKSYLIDARLTPLARKEGLESISRVVEQLKRGSASLQQSVVEAMTTNETSFFRDARPFDHLSNTVLPAIAQARQARRSLRIWSAASSTGQEAYSIAMTLRDHPAMFDSWNVQVFASDLAESVLSQAREGRYAQLEVNRGLPARKLTKWFERDGMAWRVKAELRAMVKFDKINLLAPWPATLGQFDIIFVRNVLIYFDVPTKRIVLDKMRKVLAPDGYLFLGSSEILNGVHDGFTAERDGPSVVYRPV